MARFSWHSMEAVEMFHKLQTFFFFYLFPKIADSFCIYSRFSLKILVPFLHIFHDKVEVLLDRTLEEVFAQPSENTAKQHQIWIGS